MMMRKIAVTLAGLTLFALAPGSSALARAHHRITPHYPASLLTYHCQGSSHAFSAKTRKSYDDDNVDWYIQINKRLRKFYNYDISSGKFLPSCYFSQECTSGLDVDEKFFTISQHISGMNYRHLRFKKDEKITIAISDGQFYQISKDEDDEDVFTVEQNGYCSLISESEINRLQILQKTNEKYQKILKSN